MDFSRKAESPHCRGFRLLLSVIQRVTLFLRRKRAANGRPYMFPTTDGVEADETFPTAQDVKFFSIY